jgi:UDP:flavonoid glycosyltransferase YjiC (YdhE family)
MNELAFSVNLTGQDELSMTFPEDLEALVLNEYFQDVKDDNQFEDGKSFDAEDDDWVLLDEEAPPPFLNICIMIVGSRGDVQPFIAFGQALIAYGHRVRLATHECFRAFVQTNGLEFVPLAGDPRDLMAYMVKTGGRLIPASWAEITEDIPANRALVQTIIESTWTAVTAASSDGSAYVVDAIIANPPCFGAPHVAEALQVPIHMFFTMPWSPTRAFPHPLARIPEPEPGSKQNILSYYVLDWVIWSGVADLINTFRSNTLRLDKIHSGQNGADLLNTHKIPFAYMWSRALIPKPRDWGPHIDVLGFCFLPGSGAGDWTPPEEIRTFLAAGPPPIFLGFGSCVVPDPAALTNLVLTAAREAKVRLLVQSGWGNLADHQHSARSGSEKVSADDVLFIGRAPHEWLFAHCAAVCHHGGAGTCATGLKFGLPTIVVPFFGDQTFWGSMVCAVGAGPAPIPFPQLTAQKLATAFRFSLRPDVKSRAEELGRALVAENGIQNAVKEFHKHLPTGMRCDIIPTEVAIVRCHDCKLSLTLKADAAVHHVSSANSPADVKSNKKNHVQDALLTDSEIKEAILSNPITHKRPYLRHSTWQFAHPGDFKSAVVAACGGVLDTALSGMSGMITEPLSADDGYVRGAARGARGLVGSTLESGATFMLKIGQGMESASLRDRKDIVGTLWRAGQTGVNMAGHATRAIERLATLSPSDSSTPLFLKHRHHAAASYVLSEQDKAAILALHQAHLAQQNIL